MRKNIFVIAIVAAGCFIACKKTNIDSSFDKKILGNWLVVGTGTVHNDNGMVVEWGGYYVRSIELNKDYTFIVNMEPNIGPNVSGTTNTWRLKDNHSTIVFYHQTNDNALGLIFKSIAEFKISIDAEGQLVLKDDRGDLYTHKKIGQ